MYCGGHNYLGIYVYISVIKLRDNTQYLIRAARVIYIQHTLMRDMYVVYIMLTIVGTMLLNACMLACYMYHTHGMDTGLTSFSV